jgi:aspartyl-tRNA(Asn)/glutamyl-tRNA(Gln) amidotransferase subunit B
MSRGAVIGLEIHVQLRTATKLFCADTATSAAEPNTHICPVCMGLPGALPSLNAAAVELAVRAALALGCTVHATSRFERKSYFYPDLPKGYQITQAARPLATDGVFESVRIRRVHLEEDAGRLLHDRIPGRTAIDLNRAGIPLIEIVTEPDLRAPAAARAFLTRLRRTLKHLAVSDCEMENGSLRVDANVSVQGAAESSSATRTELKNLNSFAHVERALTFEIERQEGVIAAGATVEPETLLWDEERGRTQRMRAKEESRDYRYLAEPDLPVLHVTAARIARIRAGTPELPAVTEARFAAAYDLPRYDIQVLTAEPALAAYFEAVAARAPAKAASNWVMTEVLGWLNRHGSRVEDMPVGAAALAELVMLVEQGSLSRPAARRVFAMMVETGLPAHEIVAAHGLAQVRDERTLAAWVEQTIAAFPDEVARYHAGRTKVMTFLIGQVMQLSGGTADPRRSADLMKERLDR